MPTTFTDKSWSCLAGGQDLPRKLSTTLTMFLTLSQFQDLPVKRWQWRLTDLHQCSLQPDLLLTCPPNLTLIVNQDIVPERSCLAPAVCMTPSTCSLAPCYQPLRHQFAGPLDVPDLGCAGAVGSVGAVAQQFKTGTITSTSQSNIKSASALSLSCPTRVETA